MPDSDAPQTITITVDGRELETRPGTLVIKAAEDAGIYIPRFCWHPRMKPVGMCRMCLVEVEGPRGTMLTTSCTLRANDGMVVTTESDVTVKAQEGVLEFLLINHPLDCPVCDRGGECPLQDQTMAYGPGESRFVEEKRHFEKPIEISDLVLLDRERCILCARCTRFSDEISGDPLIEFFERGNHTQVLTFPDEPFRSYFSGNTVQICPVGALTARPYRFRARPWDLEAVESTCPHCSVGCRVSVQASQNEILRFNGVDNDSTNQGWLCDKGRFGFEYINAPERLGSPLVRQPNGEFTEATWSEALDLVAERLGSLLGSEVAGIGGARSTNEEAYAFGKFLRTVIVTPHIDSQLGDGLDPGFVLGVGPRATIPDLERARTILLWGPDLKEELPVLYLRVRRAAQELGATLIVVHPRRTGLHDVAAHTIAYQPGKGAEVLGKLKAGGGDFDGIRQDLDRGPVVALVGRTGLAEDPRLPEAVAAFVRDLDKASVLPLVRRSNVIGALDMGLSPALLPGRVSASDAAGRALLEGSWGPLPDGPGKDTAGILTALVDGTVKGLLLLGSDPIGDFPDRGLAEQALESAEFVASLDLFVNESNARADVILPVEGFSESEGTVTNVEGRVQKVNRLIPGPGRSRAAWSVLDDLARRMGGDLGGTSAAALGKEIETIAPAYAGITWDLLDWGEGREGVVAPGPEGTRAMEYVPVDPGLPVTTASPTLHLARVLYDRGVHVQVGPSLERLVPEAAAYLHPRTGAGIGVAEGGRIRISGERFDPVELTVGFDSSLATNTVYVPFNLDGTERIAADLVVDVEAVLAGGEPGEAG